MDDNALLELDETAPAVKEAGRSFWSETPPMPGIDEAPQGPHDLGEDD